MQIKMQGLPVETEIIDGINKKVPEAFKYLYDKYYGALCNYASHLLNTPEEVEDIVQELFMSIYEGERVFSDVRELTNYLYRACYNNCLICLRNSDIHSSILKSLLDNKKDIDDDDDMYELTVQEELIRQLHDCIDELPQEQRNIILLRIEGFEWAEIADKLGVSLNTVKTQKSRSYKFLKEHMKYLLVKVR